MIGPATALYRDSWGDNIDRLSDIPRVLCACGSAELFGVSAGREPQISEASDIAVDAGEPIVGWCLMCWSRRFCVVTEGEEACP